MQCHPLVYLATDDEALNLLQLNIRMFFGTEELSEFNLCIKETFSKKKKNNNWAQKYIIYKGQRKFHEIPYVLGNIV